MHDSEDESMSRGAGFCFILGGFSVGLGFTACRIMAVFGIAMVFVQPAGSVRSIEFMTFTRRTHQDGSGKNHRQGSFHRQRS